MSRSQVLAVALIALAGCASGVNKSPAPVSIRTDAAPGYALHSPVAFQEASGLRLHGWICRGSSAHFAARIGADRVSAAGQVMASVSSHAPELNGRGSRCGVYDFATDWTLAAGEAVHICAVRRGDKAKSTSCG